MSKARAVEQPFDLALLERWRPALHYDPQEPYRAISARSITDFECNRLVLRDGTVLAGAGGVGEARLSLELLADTRATGSSSRSASSPVARPCSSPARNTKRAKRAAGARFDGIPTQTASTL